MPTNLTRAPSGERDPVPVRLDELEQRARQVPGNFVVPVVAVAQALVAFAVALARGGFDRFDREGPVDAQGVDGLLG